MKRILPKILAIGLVAIILGAIVFAVGLAAAKWDIRKISGITVTEDTYTETGAAQNINIKLDVTDLTVVFDENADKISLVYPTEKNKKDEVISEFVIDESGNTLNLTQKSNWKRQTILFNFTSTKATLTVPAGRIVSLNVKTDTGDVKIQGNATLTNSSIETDTGDVSIEKIDTDTLNIKVDTGKITVKGGTATNKISCESNTGDIRFSGNINSDAVEVKTDTGDFKIDGDLTSDTVTAETDTGDVEIRGNLTASLINIDTDTGDVESEHCVIDSARIIITTDTGDVEITVAGNPPDYQVMLDIGTGDSNIKPNLTGTRLLSFESDTGDLTVRFAGN